MSIDRFHYRKTVSFIEPEAETAEGAARVEDPKIYSSKEFIQLQKIWYNKLKNSGFQDIERMHPQLGSLTSHKVSMYVTQDYIAKCFLKDPSVEEYFRLARHYLAHGSFSSSLDKRIFELFSNGHTGRDIIKIIRQEGFEIKHNAVFNVITRLKKKMLEFAKETGEL